MCKLSAPWPHKVLLVTIPFLPRIGGVESIVRSLADELSARGHKVTVMTEEPTLGPERFAFRVIRRPRAVQVWREFTSTDAIIQFGDGIRLGWPLLLKRFPVLISRQGWEMNVAIEPLLRRRLRSKIARRSVNVCCSRALAQSLGAPSQVIGNPFNDKIFGDSRLPRDRDLIFVGRLIPEKGADLLLESLARLRERQIRPSTTIVGDGPQRQELQRQALTSGLREQVRFAGFVTGEALARLLNRHRVIVVPSRWEEPFGIVVLEGLACGCMVVASDGGGLPDAVGLCGRLFERGSAETMAARILEALDQAPEQDRDAYELHLRRFTPAAVIDQYLALLSEHFHHGAQ
jgi:glycogen synthase